MNFNFAIRGNNFPPVARWLPPPLGRVIQSLLARREPGIVTEVQFAEPPVADSPGVAERIRRLSLATQEGVDIAFGLLSPPSEEDDYHICVVIKNPEGGAIREPYYWGLNDGGAEIAELLRNLRDGLKIRASRLKYREVWRNL